MTMDAEEVEKGDLLVVPPEAGEHYWQPVPANGHITIKLAPDLVSMDQKFGLGTQTVPPGCYVREHLHDRNEEVLFFLSGRGRAVLDGKDYAIAPGMTIYVGKNRRHMFINDGEADLSWMWLIIPNGLETFFRAIGRRGAPDEPAPAPFPRPDDVAEIERFTVFGRMPSGRR
jgi:mannose-6-phosphate isomerase-like protein (cupin superfamily)